MIFKPSGKCFDESIELLVELIKKFQPRELLHYRLIHGVVRASADGAQIAHAWVEDGTRAIHGALDVHGNHVYLVCDADDYRVAIQATDCTAYTIEEVWAENQRTGTYGPWIDRYRALCKPKLGLVE